MLMFVRFFATPWTIARQAPLSMKFSRQEYWSGLLQGIFLFQGIFPTQGSNPSSAAPALAGGFFTTDHLGSPYIHTHSLKIYFPLWFITGYWIQLVPCAMQQDLVVYPFYKYQFASANPKFPIHHSPPLLPFGNHKSIFCVCLHSF